VEGTIGYGILQWVAGVYGRLCDPLTGQPHCLGDGSRSTAGGGHSPSHRTSGTVGVRTVLNRCPFGATCNGMPSARRFRVAAKPGAYLRDSGPDVPEAYGAPNGPLPPPVIPTSAVCVASGGVLQPLRVRGGRSRSCSRICLVTRTSTRFFLCVLDGPDPEQCRRVLTLTDSAGGVGRCHEEPRRPRASEAEPCTRG